MNTQILSTTKEDMIKAAEIIKKGGLVAFPTETVYGLGANAFDEKAVKKIYKAKGRPSDNPLIVHVAEKHDIESLVQRVTPQAKAVINAFFPGPITIILPKSDKINNTVSGGLNTVAVRMPEHPVAQRLIMLAGVPIAAPSANTSGKPSPTKTQYVIDDLNGKVNAIIDGGQCKFGVESTVLSLVDTPTILRPGAVTKEMLESVLGPVRLANAVTEEVAENEAAPSPGMKYKHYSPKAKVIILEGSKEHYEKFVNMQGEIQERVVALCFKEDTVEVPKLEFGASGDDLSQAKALFNALRQADKIGAKKVYARMPSKQGVGLAVYNRLIRAAGFKVIDLEKPYLIGLTGQTGAGKGYVGKKLAELGFNVLDTDVYARRITEKGSPTLKELQAAFGDDILTPEGELDRKVLAERAFESEEKTAILNGITHPAILALCEKEARFPAVLDAPLLFECGADKQCSVVLSVVAGEKMRLNRILKRDGITEAQAKERMSAQKDMLFYVSGADWAIINDVKIFGDEAIYCKASTKHVDEGGSIDIESQIRDFLEAIL